MPAVTHWVDTLVTLAAAAHPRLGIAAAASIQRVAASRDLLMAIMRHIPLVVPDDCPTLIAALRIAMPWQRIVLRRGEHLAGSSALDEPGGSQARLRVPVELCGEEGAVLRGTLVLEAGCAGGVISDCCIEDAGDCCLRCEGGSWELLRLRLRCAHGAALLACGAADVTLDGCVLGGERQEEVGTQVQLSAYGSVQEAKLPKRACYAVVARDEARVVARRCELRQAPALTRAPTLVSPLPWCFSASVLVTSISAVASPSLSSQSLSSPHSPPLSSFLSPSSTAHAHPKQSQPHSSSSAHEVAFVAHASHVSPKHVAGHSSPPVGPKSPAGQFSVSATVSQRSVRSS